MSSPPTIPTVAASEEGPQPKTKCGCSGCIGYAKGQELITPCFSMACKKVVHVLCHKQGVLAKFNVEALIDPVTTKQLFVCSKTCYNKVNKDVVQTPNRLPWDKDGENGPADSVTSMSILLAWLLDEGNYRKFRGTDNNGTSKMQYGQVLSDRMKDASCRTPRTAEAVVKKIQEIETKFVRAHDWASNTFHRTW